MRFGVLSDVHANLHALDAALDFLAAQEVDRYLCAGDLVGYGPFPNECVRRVLALPGVCIAGNHDLIVLGRLSDERCIPLAQASLRWTRSVLEDDTRAALEGLPREALVEDVAVHHGAPGDPQRYVITDEDARLALDAIAHAAPRARVLVLGHTHRPLAVASERGPLLRAGTGAVALQAGERVLLNPGAVGQTRSRDARARAMVLDLAEQVATFHAVDYDVDGCRRALRDRGLPPDSCQLRRSAWRGVAARVKRRAVRALGRSAGAGSTA